jgi:hypothetical protein
MWMAFFSDAAKHRQSFHFGKGVFTNAGIYA